MANFSLRMLTAFMLAALLLNASNYVFMRIFRSPKQHVYENYIYPKTSSGVEESRIPVRPLYWSTAVQCADKEKATTTPLKRRSHNYTEAEGNTFSAYYLLFSDKTKPTAKKIDDCPEMPSGLGPEMEDRAIIAQNLHNFETKSIADVKPGGAYQPTGCKALQSVAIIIAYRGCKTYLNTFMNVLHPFLIKQQLDYQIFVIEQSNTTQAYNRGKLLNVGFTEAMRYRPSGFQCIILHEPHVVPMDSRNLYRCSWYPKQLATNVERPIKASYTPLLGGAVAMTPEQFSKVNGFSNNYWGNDADYYDLYQRINSSIYFVENSYPLVGKFKTLRKGLALWHKSEYLTTPSPLYLVDGLTSLKYTVDRVQLKKLYTYLQVNIDTELEKKFKDSKMYDKVLNTDGYRTTQEIKPL